MALSFTMLSQTQKKKMSASRELNMRLLAVESESICAAEKVNLKERRKLELRWDELEKGRTSVMRRLTMDSYQMKRELTQLLDVKRKISRERSVSVTGCCGSGSEADRRTLFLDRERRASLSEAVSTWLAKLDKLNTGKSCNEEGRKYSLDNMKTDVIIGEPRRPTRSSLKSAPIYNNPRYELNSQLKSEEPRKKSVTFVCDSKDSPANVDDESTPDVENNEKDELLYSTIGPQKLTTVKTQTKLDKVSCESITNTDTDVIYSEDRPRRLKKQSVENVKTESEKTVIEEDIQGSLDRRCSSGEQESVELKVDHNNNCTESQSMYDVTKPQRLARRNTVASIDTRMKRLSLDGEKDEQSLQRNRQKSAAGHGQERRRKSGVYSMDPNFKELLEQKQNEVKNRKPGDLQERRKSAPEFALLNRAKSVDNFTDYLGCKNNQGNLDSEHISYQELATATEINSNNINALYMAKNKIANMCPTSESNKDKIKGKFRTVGIPYHTEMRMKRRGSISAQLKTIYHAEAEKKAARIKGQKAADLVPEVKQYVGQ